MLEEDIAVFVRAAHCHRMLGVQRVLAERRNSVHVAHFLEVRIIPHSDLLDLVGGTEAIEEVQERNLAFDCSQMRNGARSMTSCGFVSHIIAKPVWRQAITSE